MNYFSHHLSKYVQPCFFKELKGQQKTFKKETLPPLFEITNSPKLVEGCRDFYTLVPALGKLCLDL